MGLFSKQPKSTYSQLQVPVYQSFLMPDPRVMQKDMAMVMAMVNVTLENLEKTMGDISMRLPTVHTLESQLFTIFAQGNEELLTKLIPGICMGTRAGYLMGMLENNSGIARPNACESHYWTALIIMKMQLTKGIENEVALQVGYAFSAGYYLGRKGDLALHEILGALVNELKTMAA